MMTLDGKIEGHVVSIESTFCIIPGKMMHSEATNVAMHSCDAATFLQRKATSILGLVKKQLIAS